MDEISVGTKLGLSRKLNLATACSDFYVLEAMESELFERVPVWDPAVQQTRYKLTDMPLGHTTDSREEFRAYSVRRTLNELETNLADQFVTYLAIACGGELRHIAQRLGGHHWVKECKHTEHTAKCCFHNCALWDCKKQNQPLSCGCICAHKHSSKCKDGKKGCAAPHCCGHECSESSGCQKLVSNYQPSERVQKYLAKWGVSDGGRAAGWNDWWKLSKGDLAAWMADCAEAFFSPVWGENPGFGGPKWGTAAALVADYLNGVVTTRLFLDRCWSLQHNGGCIFNKFYTMHVKRLPKKGKVNALMHVLQQQSENEYEHLCTYFTSDYVAELWWEHQKATGKMELLDVVRSRMARQEGKPKRSAAPEGAHWPWEPETGCMYCWYHYMYNGYKDSCGSGGGGWGSYNQDCMYSESYSQEGVQAYAESF